jgi:hypothetical protein
VTPCQGALTHLLSVQEPCSRKCACVGVSCQGALTYQGCLCKSPAAEGVHVWVCHLQLKMGCCAWACVQVHLLSPFMYVAWHCLVPHVQKNGRICEVSRAQPCCATAPVCSLWFCILTRVLWVALANKQVGGHAADTAWVVGHLSSGRLP